jgi:hypothetical protein
MTIEAKVVEKSVAPHGGTITTFQLRYPRFIHAEFMTHRMFSRNASSSRAVPVAKMLEQVQNDPAMPVHWGANQPGMQAHAELEGEALMRVKQAWRDTAHAATVFARIMNEAGAHKQVVNRILEPFLHIDVIVTATEWDNFYELRDHEDAQPEIRELAKSMRAATNTFVPVLRTGSFSCSSAWHLPYVSKRERDVHFNDVRLLLKLSTARCARVSYLTHEGAVPNPFKDMELYDRLVGAKPWHASPLEHQARFMHENEANEFSNNFCGWEQHRDLFEREAENPDLTIY